MLEQPGENPFLARFYDDRAGYAFQTQLFFLFQRERQVHALAQPSMFAQTVVSDFMFAKDALFARINLSDEEYRLYAQMHQPIAAQLREPDLVVRLQALGADPARARAPARRGDGAATSTSTTCSACAMPTPTSSRRTTACRCSSSTPSACIRSSATADLDELVHALEQLRRPARRAGEPPEVGLD